MARTKEAEPKITYLNEPPKAEEIIKHLFTIYMRSQGIEVGEVEVKPSTTGKRTVTLIDGNCIYIAVEGGGVKCEKL